MGTADGTATDHGSTTGTGTDNGNATSTGTDSALTVSTSSGSDAAESTTFSVESSGTSGDGSDLPADVPTNLVAHWRLDETSGTMASDASGTGNHGVLAGGTLWTEGVIGGAAEFDGIDDGIEATANPTLNLTGAVTLSAWINIRGTNTTQTVLSRNFDMEARGYTLRINSNGVAEFHISSDCVDEVSVVTADPLPVNTWVHVAATYEPSTSMLVYVDGIFDNSLKGTVPDSQCDNGKAVGVGRRVSGALAYHALNGFVDDARIYNEAVTAAHIAELFAQKP